MAVEDMNTMVGKRLLEKYHWQFGVPRVNDNKEKTDSILRRKRIIEEKYILKYYMDLLY